MLTLQRPLQGHQDLQMAGLGVPARQLDADKKQLPEPEPGCCSSIPRALQMG